MSLTADQLKKLFPNASQAFLNQNAKPKPTDRLHPETVRAIERAADPVCEKNGAVVEPNRGDEPVGQIPRAGGDSEKHLVRYEIRRNRLIRDPENVATKAFTDALRYAGLIPEDSFDALKVEWTQTQVSKEEEGTVITIYPPGTWEQA